MNLRITAMTFVFGWETPVACVRGERSDVNAVRDSYRNKVVYKQSAPGVSKVTQMCYNIVSGEITVWRCRL